VNEKTKAQKKAAGSKRKRPCPGMQKHIIATLDYLGWLDE